VAVVSDAVVERFMRILIISLVYPPEHAPAGIMVAELADELTRAGNEVTVLTGWPSHPAGRLFQGWKAKILSRERTAGGFTLLRCVHSFAPRFTSPAKLWYHFTFAVSSFLAALFAVRFDVLVLQSTPAFCGPAAILAAWIKRARTFYWVHDIHPESAIDAGVLKTGALSTVMKAIDSWVCRRANVVATPTEEMRDILLARGLPAGHVIVQRHWLDEARVQSSPRLNVWREKQGIASESFVVLHAGTIGYLSGATVAVEAARLLADHREVLLLFVGDGPLNADLQRKVVEYGLTNVKFVPFQPEEDLNWVQATADIGLVTLRPRSANTLIPSKMYGYTSAGRPVIASVDAASTVARFVEQGQFGWVVPPGDPQALARAILHAAANPDECTSMGQKAREFLVREFGRQVKTVEFRRRLECLCNHAMEALDSR
jgi:colanic acid biosynthesis glycosyl transferase WcaI